MQVKYKTITRDYFYIEFNFFLNKGEFETVRTGYWSGLFFESYIRIRLFHDGRIRRVESGSGYGSTPHGSSILDIMYLIVLYETLAHGAEIPAGACAHLLVVLLLRRAGLRATPALTGPREDEFPW